MSVTIIGVVGAGFMGSGIAQCAEANKHVLLYAPQEAPLERARDLFDSPIGRSVEKGRISEREAGDLGDRIVNTQRLEDLRSADAVIEAVTEDAAVKRQLFAMLDEQLPAACFIASNTSSIPIAELAAATERPDRVLGLHFSSPVPVMTLVEVVVGLDTGADAVTAAESFAHEIGKQPIRTKGSFDGSSSTCSSSGV
jgi:3-hydroxybutyryl-CoA dehydrogenase